MPDSVHWTDWASRIEFLNRELEESVGDERWDRVGAIQSEKERAMESLDGCLQARILPGTPEWETLARLATQEQTLGRLFTRARDSLGEELRRTNVASGLSKRFRASYGAKDPSNPNWEHFS